jgi:hypothetical protein
MFKTAGVVTWRRHQLTRGSKVPTFNQTITAIKVGSISQTHLPWSGMLDLNYYLLGGGGLPWIDPANATQPGVNVDVMLLLIALALCAANAQAVLQRRRMRPVGAGDRVAKRSHQA